MWICYCGKILDLTEKQHLNLKDEEQIIKCECGKILTVGADCVGRNEYEIYSHFE